MELFQRFGWRPKENRVAQRSWDGYRGGSVVEMVEETPEERREHPRYPISGNLKGKLKGEHGGELSFFLVDVSCRGIGLILDTQVAHGDRLTLEITSPDQITMAIPLQVVWSNRIETAQRVYRCGFKAIDKEIDLVQLFEGLESVFVDNKT